jgi:hypothetical protein
MLNIIPMDNILTIWPKELILSKKIDKEIK